MGPVSAQIPGLPLFSQEMLNGTLWFILKTAAVIFFILLPRGVFPRIRIDLLLHVGWYRLIGLSFVGMAGKIADTLNEVIERGQSVPGEVYVYSLRTGDCLVTAELCRASHPLATEAAKEGMRDQRRRRRADKDALKVVRGGRRRKSVEDTARASDLREPPAPSVPKAEVIELHKTGVKSPAAAKAERDARKAELTELAHVYAFPAPERQPTRNELWDRYAASLRQGEG